MLENCLNTVTQKMSETIPSIDHFYEIFYAHHLSLNNDDSA